MSSAALAHRQGVSAGSGGRQAGERKWARVEELRPSAAVAAGQWWCRLLRPPLLPYTMKFVTGSTPGKRRPLQVLRRRGHLGFV